MLTRRPLRIALFGKSLLVLVVVSLALTLRQLPVTADPGPNAMAVDAVSGGGVDPSRTVTGTLLFDTDILISDATDPYAQYQFVLQWDPAVLAFDSHVDLQGPTSGGEFEFCAPATVEVDTVKGSCHIDGDTVPGEEGLCYDRSAGGEPNPPRDAGAPNGVIDIGDVLAALAQFGLDCTGEP